MDKRIEAYFNGELSKEEQLNLLKDVNNCELLRQEWIEYSRIHSLLLTSSRCIDVKAGNKKQKIFSDKLKQKQKRNFGLKSFSYAATIIISMFIARFVTSSSFESKIRPYTSQTQVFHVPAGQRADIILSDGSKVYLNSGSTLTYSSVFGLERKVSLSGEGFFEVAKDPSKPFIVATKSMEIEALGTKFNVFSYPNKNYSTVYLKEGKVKACLQNDKENAVIMLPSDLLTQSGDAFEIKSIGDKDQLWLDGIYEFRSEKFKDIIEKLELYYDVNIVVEDDAILDYKITGKFRQRDGVMEIFRIIQNVHPFKIKENRESNKIILTL